MLTVGCKGIDYSGFRPDPHQVVKDGARFIIRYSAGAGNKLTATQWKLCGANEIANAVAAGLDFIANSEWYESRVTEGAAAGAQDGAADLAFWQSRGLNRGASIYVSWDTSPVQSLWAQADAYLRAYDKALGGIYHVDCYAGTQYLKHALAAGIIRHGWRPNAGSWSNDGITYQPSADWITANLAAVQAKTPAAIWQTGNYWYNKQADELVLLRANVGSHLQAAIVPARPTDVIPAKPLEPRGMDRWASGTALPLGSGITSANGKHQAVFQLDGNFVIYNDGKAAYATNTAGIAISGRKLDVQPDGNLVMYGAPREKHVLWQTHTARGAGQYVAVMQDDGNFVIYDATSHKPLWWTKR